MATPITQPGLIQIIQAYRAFVRKNPICGVDAFLTYSLTLLILYNIFSWFYNVTVTIEPKHKNIKFRNNNIINEINSPEEESKDVLYIRK